MAWTNALDSATPAGSAAPSTIDDHLRLIKAALQERLNADHYWPLAGTAVSSTDAGKHRKVTAKAVLSVKPTLLTGEAALYTKTVSGVSEWFWEDSAGTEHQLTSGGAPYLTSSDLLGLLANNTYLTAVDNAGTGTVDLIKANASDAAVLPDASLLATSAAPTTDAMIANKKYVDDKWTAWTGEESITMPNGLILKMGVTAAISSNTVIEVTYGVAFPNAFVTAWVCPKVYNDAADYAQGCFPKAGVETDILQIGNYFSPAISQWFAIGY